MARGKSERKEEEEKGGKGGGRGEIGCGYCGRRLERNLRDYHFRKVRLLRDRRSITCDDCDCCSRTNILELIAMGLETGLLVWYVVELLLAILGKNKITARNRHLLDFSALVPLLP